MTYGERCKSRSPVFSILGLFVPKWRKLDILAPQILRRYNIGRMKN